jgi:hypothetical protein
VEVLNFEGEFGFEVGAFIPMIYKRFLVQGINHRIVSYRGMEPFYYFLPEDAKQFREGTREFKPNCVARYTGDASDNEIDPVNLLPPPYRDVFGDGDFAESLNERAVVINKFCTEWGKPPINFFSDSDLHQIFAYLKSFKEVTFFPSVSGFYSDKGRGYSRDHSEKGKTKEQVQFSVRELQVASEYKNVRIFDHSLEKGDSYNEKKLRVMAQVGVFFVVQGGNAHLSSLFKNKKLAIKHVEGNESNFTYHSGYFQKFSGDGDLICWGSDVSKLISTMAL